MLYPLKCKPVYQQKIWGGQTIYKHFHRVIPTGKIGESWELCAREEGMSVVTNGPFQGRTLQELIEKYGRRLLGTNSYAKQGTFFPLLIKIIDANDRLSVQVHPDDVYAKAHGEPNGKNEFWYIIDAKPGAELIYGLKSDTTREALSDAIRHGKIDRFLRRIPVHAGDVIYIPAGTVHAILDGILLAEIQQNSNTTYRLYDWDRVDANGKKRPLHVQQALESIHFGQNPLPRTPEQVNQTDTYCLWNILKNAYFRADKLELNGSYLAQTDGTAFYVCMDLKGSGSLLSEAGECRLSPGDTVLIPADMGPFRLSGKQDLLFATI